ncbi:transcriptional regulator CadC [Fictibacillus macauensis ZFHKF-1]|uniref:Transcriptional regulator CadC n=1 Tax=Fictibacillus macauensis ZFHKF-1 TaxID=1196324 RepID=I8J534_9BACL|nr:FHA domain-containing protein [Fictibacillus macauensis]EIT86916.1 transcriptional regulator CadC [Fictibacillus macauensis ZFHKF-1]
MNYTLVIQDETQQKRYVPLKEKIIVGRSSVDSTPDIILSSPYVSRTHCMLTYLEGRIYVKDLNSLHGTFINGERISPGVEIELRLGDVLTLAYDRISIEIAEMDADATLTFTPIAESSSMSITVDELIERVAINNQWIPLSSKEFQCFKLLYSSYEHFVSKEQLKAHVWSERIHSPEVLPDVGSEELNALLYRLRKKLLPHLQITSIGRKGYLLQPVSLS